MSATSGNTLESFWSSWASLGGPWQLFIDRSELRDMSLYNVHAFVNLLGSTIPKVAKQL
jgi:hypothetical protein